MGNPPKQRRATARGRLLLLLLGDQRLRSPLRAVLAGIVCLVCLGFSCAGLLDPAPAGALIAAPATVDGPSAAIGEFGGAAVSEDGTGGVVYTKLVEGVQHVFVARYAGGQWRSPVRVDWDTPYAASFPRIAAADDGWLVVVWVSQIATVGGKVRDALYSSTLLPGSSEFAEPIIVDPDVGEGMGVDPSLAIASNGQGLVAYRAVTDNYKAQVLTTIPQLRPGDVLADIRVARYEGQLWGSPQRVDRDPLLTTRSPTESNGPQAGIGRGDQAVVAWQESESSGTARIWARRVFGSSLGLALQASPTTFSGQPVTAEAEAFSLGVSEFGEAKVVSRLTGPPGTAISGARLFVNTLPVSTAPAGSQFTGAEPLRASAPAAGSAGAPSVAVDDSGDYRIAFATGSTAEVIVGSEQLRAAPEVPLGGALIGGGAGAVTSLNPVGGGVTAWPARSASGQSGIDVREDYPNGGAQSALVSGAIDGPISALAIGGSETGESLLGAREGNVGEYEIVGMRITVPPPPFSLETPIGWVTPAKARLHWLREQDATGAVTYSLAVDGRIVQRGIAGTSVLPNRRLLGSGVRDVQILATDPAGQQTLSGEGQLKIDGSPPLARVRQGRAGVVVVTVRDAQSGALARATRIAFGDGARASGRLKVRHRYRRPGRYTIAVRMRDRVGNAATAYLRVAVR